MVGRCASWACDRLISISRVPGGNPKALAEPEVWATEFSICEDCKAYLCDRCTGGCAGERGGRLADVRCPECSGALADGRSRREQVRAMPSPDSVTYCDEGLALIDAGRPADGLELLDRALRLRPDYPLLQLERSRVLWETGRGREALAALDDVLRIDPGYAPAAQNKGNYLSRLGERSGAIDAYRRAVDVEPRFVAPRVNLAVLLLETGDLRGALSLCDETVRLIEADRQVPGAGKSVLPHAYAAKGRALAELGRGTEGLGALDTALALGLDDAGTHGDRAAVLDLLGRREEARLARQSAEERRRQR